MPGNKIYRLWNILIIIQLVTIQNGKQSRTRLIQKGLGLSIMIIIIRELHSVILLPGKGKNVGQQKV